MRQSFLFSVNGWAKSLASILVATHPFTICLVAFQIRWIDKLPWFMYPWYSYPFLVWSRISCYADYPGRKQLYKMTSRMLQESSKSVDQKHDWEQVQKRIIHVECFGTPSHTCSLYGDGLRCGKTLGIALKNGCTISFSRFSQDAFSVGL